MGIGTGQQQRFQTLHERLAVTLGAIRSTTARRQVLEEGMIHSKIGGLR